MGIDASIYSQIQQPKIESPLNALAQVAQVQGAQSQNRLADLKFAEAEREVGSDNALASLLSAGKKGQDIVNGLAGKGYGKQAISYQKQLTEQESSAANLTGVKLGNETKEYELQQKKRIAGIQRNASLINDPALSYEKFVAHVQQAVDSGETRPEAAMAFIKQVPQDPAGLKSFLTQQLLSSLSPDKQAEAVAPKVEMRDTGGALTGIQMNPYLPGYGQPVQGSQVAKTQTPDSIATNATSRENNINTVGATIRGQDKVDARSREANALPKGQIVQTDQGTMLVDPRTGTAQPVTAGGQALQPKLKDLPAPIQKSLIENSTSLRKIDSALAAIKAYPDALGAKNYLGDTIRQRSDPGGVDARALVADIGSLKIHDRSGAAVTAAETPRLKPFIPSATDNPETVEKKLNLFKKEYEAIQSDITSTYTREQGYKPPTVTPVGGLPSDIDALLKKHGGK